MKKVRLAAIFAAAAIALSGCATGRKSTIISVGDKKISGADVDFYITELVGAGADYEGYKENAAEDIENAALIGEVGKKWGFTLSDDEQDSVNSQLIRIRQQMGGKKAFDETLKKYGASEEFVKMLLESSVYESKVQAALENEEITEEEMRAYFTDNYLRAKHVLIMTKDMTTGEDLDRDEAKAKADEVLEKAQAGEDFNSLIDTYGEDPGMSMEPDGYVFTEGDMVSEFYDETKALAIGEIGMCESDYGFHIIQRLALDETPELFEELYSDNSTAVYRKIESENYNEAIKAKAEEYGIKYEINEEALFNLEQLPQDED